MLPQSDAALVCDISVEAAVPNFGGISLRTMCQKSDEASGGLKLSAP